MIQIKMQEKAIVMLIDKSAIKDKKLRKKIKRAMVKKIAKSLVENNLIRVDSSYSVKYNSEVYAIYTAPIGCKKMNIHQI